MNYIASILYKILWSSLSASIMIIIVLLIKKAFQKKLPIRLMALLWTLVVMRLMVPVTLQSPVNIEDIFSRTTVEAVTPSNEMSLIDEDISYTSDENDIPNTALSIFEEQEISVPLLSDKNQNSRSSFFDNAIMTFKNIDINIAGIIVWISGGFFILIYMTFENIIFLRFINNRSHLIKKPYIKKIVLEQKSHFNLNCDVAVLSCDILNMQFQIFVDFCNLK